MNISIRERTADDAEMFYDFITKLDNEAENATYKDGKYYDEYYMAKML